MTKGGSRRASAAADGAVKELNGYPSKKDEEADGDNYEDDFEDDSEEDKACP